MNFCPEDCIICSFKDSWYLVTPLLNCPYSFIHHLVNKYCWMPIREAFTQSRHQPMFVELKKKSVLPASNHTHERLHTCTHTHTLACLITFIKFLSFTLLDLWNKLCNLYQIIFYILRITLVIFHSIKPPIFLKGGEKTQISYLVQCYTYISSLNNHFHS